MPSDISDVFEALRSHPAAMAAAIFILALAARIVSRIAFYVFMAVLVAVTGAFWTQEFMEWLG